MGIMMLIFFFFFSWVEWEKVGCICEMSFLVFGCFLMMVIFVVFRKVFSSRVLNLVLVVVGYFGFKIGNGKLEEKILLLLVVCVGFFWFFFLVV